LWVSSEIGGCLSDRPRQAHHTDKINFNFACGAAIHRLASASPKDGKTASYAQPANRVAVVDAVSHAVTNIFWSASGSGTWRHPGRKISAGDHGCIQHVSVIDVSAQR
jgi:hypothetical protein